MTKYTEEIAYQIFHAYHNEEKSIVQIFEETGIPRSSVHMILNNPKYQHLLKDEFNLVDKDPIEAETAADAEIIEENIRLAKKVQTFMDRNRIERKSFREHARVDIMLKQQTEDLIELLKERSFNFATKAYPDAGPGTPIGVIQMSDHHINEVVNDLESNKFDIYIASKRIQKHIARSVSYFKAHGVKKVVVAMTGDLIKNSQFISEITENSMDRANATILAVELYAQAILHLNAEGFNIVLAGVVGNESRIAEKFDTTDFLAGESFDLMILKFLQIIFAGQKGIEIVPMTNPLECVININGSNLLLVHGNAHGRLSNNGSIEKGVEVIKARYGSIGVKIDYVIMGHIHSAYVGDKFARSSGLPGSNSYSERTLNLNGKASQNSYLFWNDGSIDGIKVDLQNTDGYVGYELDDSMADLAIKLKTKAASGTMNIIASYVV